MLLNKTLRNILLGILTFLLFNCRQKITFPGFNSQAWKADAFSCQGVRNKLVPDLQKIRLNLRTLSTREIIDVLGKPDAEALLADNQRIYYYYIEPGTQCQNKRELSVANKLMVRFNALEKASEVNFEKPIVLE